MKIDRIIGKARMLGISTGDGDKSNELLNIANSLGLVKDGHYDLDEVENSLDAMLEEHEDAGTTTEEETYEDVPLQHRNAMNNKVDREKLRAESRNRTQDKINEGSSKMNPTEESAEDSSNDDGGMDKEGLKKDGDSHEEPENAAEKKKKPFQFKKAKEGAKNAKNTLVNGIKKVASFFIRHPFAANVIGIVLIVVILIFSLLFDSEDFKNGYFDRECDYNLTYVDYSCDDIVAGISLKNFVMGSAYAYSQDYEFSTGALKALMIAIKTSVLADGEYTNTAKSVSVGCSVKYEIVPDDVKSSYEKYYKSIERYLYISASHTGPITFLTGADSLNISDEYIEKIANSESSNYKTILREVYGGSKSSSSSKPSSTSLDPTKETIYIGDSRMNGMANYGIVDKDHAVYHGAQGYFWFRYNTNYGSSCNVHWYSYATNDPGVGAINLANQKMNSGKSYNIVSWLGVNDTEHINQYFEVYKALAEGEWSKHNIYIAQVGPVNESMYSQNSYHRTNQDVIDFNNTMASLIADAGLDNLVYLDLGLTQDSINWNGTDGVHYGKADYQMIFNLFQSSSGYIGGRDLYDLGDYCEFHHQNNGNGCDAGWWWPIGTPNSEGGIYSAEPTPDLTHIYSQFSSSRDIGYGAKAHKGVDIGGNFDDVVIASRSGVVTYINNVCPTKSSGATDDCGGGGGNVVYLTHDDGTGSRYLHMTKGSVVVQVGERVSQGQKLGLIGSSGSSTGAHLHFEILINGTQVNPLNYISATNPRPGANGCSYSTDKAGVCRAIKDLGLSDEASAGILTNIAAEGGYKTNNLENCYENNRCCIINGANYGYCVYGGLIGPYGNDEAYTTAVSNGVYQYFAEDHAGYGLIQWTAENRKANLLRYFEELKDEGRASSIADINVQVGFMLEEINTSFPNVKRVVYDPASSAYDIAYYFCRYYENPAGDCSARASNANNILNYVKNGCSD